MDVQVIEEAVNPTAVRVPEHPSLMVIGGGAVGFGNDLMQYLFALFPGLQKVIE
jgi:hypothetical protein